ncbi:Fe-S protein [Vespertiliibacter pulmonis]|uniref:MOSC domain-containing protein n=1 Tax=Vespertiliibacter pulmonis TaxID=1443036 RepID=A0A3N4VRZ5_9PAST|nr:MOSC domain-containing protein [Vespertiliibacter pulmonis]QLB21377.1 Fe-S protein [Vespertiliibacter pulmonis]RPE85788.1 hypothetical protein EDC46_0168 [Vespertiliibacter pulmonis]
MKVTQLNIFPIKSTRAYPVHQAFVQLQGLNFDREFMITELDGTLITARKEAVLYCLSAFPISTGIIICDEKGEQCVAFYQDFIESQISEVWGTHFNSLVANQRVNEWLSKKFKRSVQLRWLGAESQRKVAQLVQNPLSFADSNPILLLSEKSLDQLQQWSPVPISMEQFRGNIVIDGNVAFAEEQWQRLKIGDVVFKFSQCCTRCPMITRDLNTLELNSAAEPLKTLKKYHTNDLGKPIFGIHLVPENSGVIRLNDSIILLN